MALFLSALCAAFAAFTLLAQAFAHIIPSLGLPYFTGTACALVGIIIAGLEYRHRKGRKKKRTPMLLMIVNSLVGIIAASVWLLTLIR